MSVVTEELADEPIVGDLGGSFGQLRSRVGGQRIVVTDVAEITREALHAGREGSFDLLRFGGAISRCDVVQPIEFIHAPLAEASGFEAQQMVGADMVQLAKEKHHLRVILWRSGGYERRSCRIERMFREVRRQLLTQLSGGERRRERLLGGARQRSLGGFVDGLAGAVRCKRQAGRQPRRLRRVSCGRAAEGGAPPEPDADTPATCPMSPRHGVKSRGARAAGDQTRGAGRSISCLMLIAIRRCARSGRDGKRWTEMSDYCHRGSCGSYNSGVGHPWAPHQERFSS